MEEIHEESILLWIRVKDRDSKSNLAQGIFFALTDQAWPSNVSEVDNSIALCDVLSQAFGQPALNEEQIKLLDLKALALALKCERGGWLMFLDPLIWADRIGYVLAVIALVVSGLSFWVAGLAAAVWMCHGVARTATRMRKRERRPDWEIPVISALHLASLLALYIVSILKLVYR